MHGLRISHDVKDHRSHLGLAVILLLAASLRFAGLDWDRGYLVHPDERRILMVVNELHWPRPWDWSLVLSPRSPLNPQFFAYGSLPLYLLRLLGTVMRLGPERLYLAGRMLSASFDLLTVLVVYLAGRRLWSRRVGLMGAAFYSIAVLAIQLSHFFTVDTLLTLLCTLTVFSLFRVVENGSLKAGILAGALTGLALATKASAFLLLVTSSVAWILWARGCHALAQSQCGGKAHGEAIPVPGPRSRRRALGPYTHVVGIVLCLVTAACAFLLAEPYSLLDWFRFGMGLAQESAMARGFEGFVYIRQYIGTLPYLYQLRETVLWSLGLPLGLLGLAGLFWLSWRGLRERRPAVLLLLAWLWPYLLVVGSFQAKFSRYMAPLIPWLCLLAAVLLWRLWDRVRMTGWLRWLPLGLEATVFLVTLLYALAFTSIYLRLHPWLAASQWICQRVPSGATLAVEVWDDPLPIRSRAGLEQLCETEYQQLWLDLHQLDSENALDELAVALTRADYVVLSSQRLYATLGRLPERYPLAAAYYRLLFSEKLGFRLVDVRTNYPRLGPVALIDEPLARTGLPFPEMLSHLRPAPLMLSLGRADESYSVYDHPRTLIFRKETALSASELRYRILSAAQTGA